MKTRPFTFTLSLLAATLCGAQAQTPATAPQTTTKLDTFIVSANRTPGSIGDLPISASILTQEQIKDTPAQSLDQVMFTVPGVNISELPSFSQHPTANGISMRGLGGIRSLVLLDGIPLNDAFFGYVQWNRVPLEFVDHVEVVRGGASSLWGNYAMGGVINIITKAADHTGASFEGGYGSFNTYRLSATDTYVVSGALKLQVGASLFDTDGYNAVPAKERAPLDIPTSFHAKNVQASALITPSSDLKGYVRVNYHENHQTLGTRRSTNRQHNTDLSAGFDQTIGDSTLTANAWYQDSHFVTKNPDTPAGFAPRFAEYVQNLHTTPVKDIGGSAQWTANFTGPVRQFLIGADYRLVDGEDRSQIFNEAGSQVRLDLGKGKQAFQGLFSQITAKPFAAPLELILSSRLDHWRNFDGFDGNPGGIGRTPDKSKSSLNPRLGARYQISKEVGVRGAVYRSFRAPNLDNLYRAFSIPGGIFQANSQLEPETMTGGEVGLDVRHGAAHGEFTVFRNEVRNLIGSRNLAFSELPAGFFFGSRNINIGKVRSQGLEALGDFKVTDTLTLNASYTFTDSKVVDNALDPTTVGNQVGGIPRNTATAGLVCEPTRAWKIAVNERWVDHLFADNAKTLPQDAHFVTDLYSSYQVSPQVQLFGSVANVFGEKYIASNSGFGPEQLGTPFQVFAGIKVQF